MTFQSWKLRSGDCTGKTYRWLQWSHDFSVMETFLHSHQPIWKFASFNGAMTFQSWKRQILDNLSCGSFWLQWSHDFSVMETISNNSLIGIFFFGFNGAMTFQSWKLKIACPVSSTSVCFNGAMTFQSWKQLSILKSHCGHFASMEP